MALVTRRTIPPRRRAAHWTPLEGLESRTLFAVTLLSDGFEGTSLTGWTARTYDGGGSAPKWGVNSLKAYAGRGSAFVAGPDRNTYADRQHTGMIKQGVSLVGYGSASLSFKYFLNTEAGYDFFSVNVLDSSGRATNVFRDSGDDREQGWRSKTISLVAFAGRSGLGIEFRFDSDASLVNEAPSGVWVDDVKLTADARPSTSTIRGTVFDDADGDRVRDSGEGPLANWTVYLDQNQNRRRDSGELTRTTDTAGRYTFTGLSPGTYYVAEELKSGFTQTSPAMASVNGGGQFSITLSYADSSLGSAQRSVLSAAARRWTRVIVGDLPDVTDDGRRIDDILIEASAREIDGRGGILAQASPSAFREASGPGGNLPYRGQIEIDLADAAALSSAGQLLDVLTHEMAHVLGFGTMWEEDGLLRGAGTSNPRFAGPVATAQYNALFSRSDTSVPVEGDGGPGTHDTHWREATFGSELLTGFIDAGANPISRVTVGSMADLGYIVNLAAAEGYAAPGRTPSNPPAAAVQVVAVGAGQTRSGIDFGNRRVTAPASAGISGTVFRDADGDGVRDTGEGGVARAKVYLDANGNDRLDSGERSVLSADNGSYTLTGLPAGGLTVRVLAPSGYARSYPSSGKHTVQLAAGASVTGKNFGLAPLGRITGRVFADADGDGTRDTTEAGAGSIRVYLDANANGRFDSGETSVLTESNGTYTFSNMRPATYLVQVDAGSGWRLTSASSHRVVLGLGHTASGNNFGLARVG